MKRCFNYDVNIDNNQNFLYNSSNILKFAYEDFFKFKSIFYPEDCLSILREPSSIYIYSHVNNEHDKVFRTILDDAREATAFINKSLDLHLNDDSLEKYKENYVTEHLLNNQTDIVYKVKNKNVFILIEHQTKVDFSMPYRIMTYQYEIIKSATQVHKLKLKQYKIPCVIPIVLYTGTKKWNAKEFFRDSQESFFQYNGQDLGNYKLVDANAFSEKDLFEDKTFLSKAMLIERKRNSKQIVQYLDRIVDLLNNGNSYSQKQKELLGVMLDLTLRRKIDDDNVTDTLIQKLKNNEGGSDMLAILDTIDEENRRILNRGIRKGRQEGRQEGIQEGRQEGRQEGLLEGRKIVAQKLKFEGASIDMIVKCTGLSKEQIEKL